MDDASVEEGIRAAVAALEADDAPAAGAIIASLLGREPDHPLVLHLAGLIAQRRGDLEDACALLARALVSARATSSQWLAHAELALLAGRTAEAIASARVVAGREPARPDGWSVLGVALLAVDDPAGAREAFRAALAADQGHPGARRGLASALLRLGEPEAGARELESLLAVDPGDTVSRATLLQLRIGRAEYAAAERLARAGLERDPGSVDARLGLVLVDLQRGRYWDALAHLGPIEDQATVDTRVALLRVHLLRFTERFDAALEAAAEALGRWPGRSDFLHVHALALQAVGRSVEALTAFDAAAAASASPAAVLSDKGVLLTQLGRFADAIASFDAALVADPTLADAWYNRALARHHAPDDPALAAMAALLARALPVRAQILLHFALGKALDEAGDIDGAFAHWQSGNRLRRAELAYDEGAAMRQLAACALRPVQPTPTLPAGSCRGSELPVFIVGMPRSGSSLIEQILAAHPDVFGAGELLRLREEFERLAEVPRDADDHEAAATRILTRLTGLAPAARRVLDKDLLNFQYLGTLHELFPRARVIHCRRDPVDTCFSAYTQLFQGTIDFSYDLAELGHYYGAYAALMAHWRRVLPDGVLLEVDYESVVADPEREARRMVAFLGLPWDPACLRFFDHRRPVATASAAQVRRPVYASGVGRGRAYASHLGYLLDALRAAGIPAGGPGA